MSHDSSGHRLNSIDQGSAGTFMELRCESTLLAVMIDADHIELPCKRRRCGKRPGVVVLHTIDITTGQVISTRKFADPARKDNSNASD